jgi:hypothetical protein
MFSDSRSLIRSIKNRNCCGTAVTHIATKSYLAADMARDREIDLRYVPTADILADCFTNPLPMPVCLKECAALGIIGIGLGNGLGTLGNGLGIRIGNGHANGIRIESGNGIGISVGKPIDSLGTFVWRRSSMFDSLFFLFVCWFLFEKNVIAVLE